jgi:hypothetical protein
MRVSDLQSFLQALGTPLEASGARREILDDLKRACEALQPFAELQIKDFAGFLGHAEEYHRTGVIPVQTKPARAPRQARQKLPAIALDDAHQLVASLHERCLDEGVSHEHIATEVQKLEAMSANNLKEIAKQFGVVPGKSKKGSLDAILDKIARRKTTPVTTQS